MAVSGSTSRKKNPPSLLPSVSLSHQEEFVKGFDHAELPHIRLKAREETVLRAFHL